jgi:hypothetical protein
MRPWAEAEGYGVVPLADRTMGASLARSFWSLTLYSLLACRPKLGVSTGEREGLWSRVNLTLNHCALRRAHLQTRHFINCFHQTFISSCIVMRSVYRALAEGPLVRE